MTNEERRAARTELRELAAKELFESERADFIRGVKKALTRVRRRQAAIERDIARIGDAAALADRAQLFVVEAARAPRGVTELTATDWSTGEAVTQTMSVESARTAREQVEAIFRRARRLKLGKGVADKRLADAKTTEAALLSLQSEAVIAVSSAELDALIVGAVKAAPGDFARPGGDDISGRPSAKRSAEPAPSRPYRVFSGNSGKRILVGRGASHNDELTLHVAKPRDLWLHAKGHTGAHVVVPLEKNATCPADLLVEAAHLAAHFSSARGELVVEVSYTPRRYIRKPRGSAAGLVAVDREKVIVVRINAATLAELLAREQIAS